MKVTAPSCQLSPVTKNSSAAAAEPTQANPASSCFFFSVRSATAPSSGSSSAEMTVEAVITNDGSAPGATESPSTEIRFVDRGLLGHRDQVRREQDPATVVAKALLAQS